MRFENAWPAVSRRLQLVWGKGPFMAKYVTQGHFDASMGELDKKLEHFDSTIWSATQ